MCGWRKEVWTRYRKVCLCTLEMAESPWDSAEVDLGCCSLIEEIYHMVCCLKYNISNLKGFRVV